MQFNLFTTVGSSVGLEGEMVKIPIARNLLWTGKDLGPCAIEDFFFPFEVMSEHGSTIIPILLDC